LKNVLLKISAAALKTLQLSGKAAKFARVD
jgi:hypothetical protein